MSETPEAEVPVEAEPTRASHRGKPLNILSVVGLIAALVASPFAVIFGYIAMAQIRKSDQRGASMAWTAVGLGWLWLSLYIVVGVALFTIWQDNPFWP